MLTHNKRQVCVVYLLMYAVCLLRFILFQIVDTFGYFFIILFRGKLIINV